MHFYTKCDDSLSATRFFLKPWNITSVYLCSTKKGARRIALVWWIATLLKGFCNIFKRLWSFICSFCRSGKSVSYHQKRDSWTATSFYVKVLNNYLQRTCTCTCTCKELTTCKWLQWFKLSMWLALVICHPLPLVKKQERINYLCEDGIEIRPFGLTFDITRQAGLCRIFLSHPHTHDAICTTITGRNV